MGNSKTTLTAQTLIILFLLSSLVLAIRDIKSPVLATLHLGFFIAIIVIEIVIFRRYGRQRRRDLFFTALFEELKPGEILLDKDGFVTAINSSACRLLSVSRESVTPKTRYVDIVMPLLEPIAEKLASAIEHGDQFSREFRVFLPSGVRCILCDFYAITAVSQRDPIFLLSLEDTTAQDDIRQKLSMQLEETHKYARLKEKFFANMSHEIRTPINAILGMTYFLKVREKDEKSREYIDKIENASELLLRVVNDILDFSKMNENKFSLKPENFNLNAIRKVLIDLFGEKCFQKGLDLHIEFNCPESFIIYGDQFRLTQVFMNLVSNAIKFTDKGFVSVSVNTETIGTEVILRCTVRDTGCGISEDDLTKLFTEFEQFGEVLHKSHEGSGLGLAISKRLVELMHGVIWVDSSPDHGSSFHFVVVLGAPVSVGEWRSPESAPAMPVIAKKSGIVLVVEDNAINSEIAAALLAESGFSAEHAGDGLEAVDMCRVRPVNYYDLILMDIHMPRLNGYDAARRLKDELRIECPIVAVTATSETTDVLEANRDVISGYILKPYDPSRFRSLFAD
jgi:signal transduction histidine kinase/CheY-like chemotaxis protein